MSIDKKSIKNPWQTLQNKVVYENQWIRVEHRDVINPAGGKGIYGLVHFKNLAIGIVPLDEQNNTWLVGQYRYTLNQYSWEIPEGGGSPDVDPVESAQRELLEETGIRAKTWTKILDVHISNSVTDEYGLAFVARDLSFGESQPEDTEQLRLRKLPFEEAVEMVIRGEITDSLAMVSILKLKVLMDRGEL